MPIKIGRYDFATLIAFDASIITNGVTLMTIKKNFSFNKNVSEKIVNKNEKI